MLFLEYFIRYSFVDNTSVFAVPCCMMTSICYAVGNGVAEYFEPAQRSFHSETFAQFGSVCH